MKKIIDFIAKKRLLLLLISLIILVVGVILLIMPKGGKRIVDKKDNGIIANTNKEIIKEEVYKGIKFDNISLHTKDGQTTFTANITNTLKEDINIERLHIILKDNDGKEVVRLLVSISNGLKKGEKRSITASASGSYNGVASKEIVD